MDTENYLKKILKDQELTDGSPELTALQRHRQEVEGVLKVGFPKCWPTIRYGGSKAKDTLIRELYDLDLVCYFPADDTTAGATLKDIYENAWKVLADQYYVNPKTSSLRLKDSKYKTDFHIDVVPGRYVDTSKKDCFIYQNGDEKDRLKTNLDVHISHVRGSGVTPALRLLKLWKVRRAIGIKQFAFELLIIKLLKNKKASTLDAQLTHVLTSIHDAKEPITVEDPANPSGNDLSQFVMSAWSELAMQAKRTLAQKEQSGWEAVFGPIDDGDTGGGGRTEIIRQAAASIITPPKPWATLE